MSGLPSTTPWADYVNSPSTALFALTNQDREQAGVPDLTWNTALDKLSTKRANDQVPGQPLNHYLPDGSMGLAGAFGIWPVQTVYGENLARGWSKAQTPDDMRAFETALMNSPLHRQNILDPEFKNLSVGTNTSGDTFAEIFGG